MRKLLTLAIMCFCFVFPAFAGNDLIIKQSPHDVATTLDRLSGIMKKKGITIFARVDHGAGAAKINASLRPTQLLIFGNPKLGTPLMQSNQQIGIALPLKALAWQDADGKTWLAYTKPSVLAERFSISDRAKVIAKMTGALDKLTNAAIKQ